MTEEKAALNSRWWIAVKDRSTGPYTSAYLAASLRSGLVSADQLVCPVDGSEWRPVQEWSQLQPYLPEKSPRNSPAAVTSAPKLPNQPSALDPFFPPTRIVQALAIYGIAINPMLWLVSTLTTCLSGTTFADNTEAQGMEALLLLGSLLVSLTFAAGWLVVGLFLNRFDQRGLWWAMGVYASSWIIGALYLLLYVALFAAFPQAEQRIQQPAEGIAALFGLILSVVEFAFQTTATILLYVNRQAIPWKNSR